MALHRAGAVVIGLCGGYQMLGQMIADPQGLEGEAGETPGLGLLDCTTVLAPQKTVRFSGGVDLASGEAVSGYEIHLGQTGGKDTERPMLQLDDGRKDGAVSADGRVMGCYMHGLFAADGYRSHWIAGMGGGAGSMLDFEATVEEGLEALADHLETHADIAALAHIAGVELG